MQNDDLARFLYHPLCVWHPSYKETFFQLRCRNVFQNLARVIAGRLVVLYLQWAKISYPSYHSMRKLIFIDE